MKDHELRELVNELTKIAKEAGQTQQCRERIKNVLFPAIEKIKKDAFSAGRDYEKDEDYWTYSW